MTGLDSPTRPLAALIRGAFKTDSPRRQAGGSPAVWATQHVRPEGASIRPAKGNALVLGVAPRDHSGQRPDHDFVATTDGDCSCDFCRGWRAAFGAAKQ